MGVYYQPKTDIFAGNIITISKKYRNFIRIIILITPASYHMISRKNAIKGVFTVLGVLIKIGGIL